MPPRNFYQPRETTDLASRLRFSQQAQNDIWRLGFEHSAKEAISSLSSLLDPPQPDSLPMPDPLPVVVSDRPDAMQIREHQQRVQAPSGEPAPMPTAPQQPQTVDATFQDGRTEPQPQMRPGESVGDVTISQGAAPQAGGDLQAYARSVAQRYGVDPDIFVRQINQESGFNPGAKSPMGAAGIAQFMPGTAASYGLTDPYEPYAALDAAARHMRDNLQHNGGDYRKALAAYNAGQGAVDKYGDVPPYDETQNYVRIILGNGPRPNAGVPTAPAASPPASAAAASSPAPPAAEAPKIRVRDPWGNEYQFTQEQLDRRPGGSKDLTILGPAEMQKVGADMPESVMSAGDQKRTKLAAARGETPQPGTDQPITNPDGSVTTERSITVTEPGLNGGRPTNIPTVWGGRIVSDDEAIDNAIRSGRPWPSFGSIDEAVSAAEQRSRSLGAGGATSVGGASVPPEVQNAQPYRNRAVRGEPLDEGGVQYRQPLNAPTSGPDTFSQDQTPSPSSSAPEINDVRQYDDGPRESGYVVPPDPAQYGAAGDDPGATNPVASGQIVSQPPEITMSNGGEPTPAAQYTELPLQRSRPTPVDAQFSNGSDPLTDQGFQEVPVRPMASKQVPVWNDQQEIVGYRQVDEPPAPQRIHYPNERQLAPERGRDTGVTYGPEEVPAEGPSRWSPEVQASLRGTAANPDIAPFQDDQREPAPSGPVQSVVSSAGRSQFLNEPAANQAVDIYSAIQELPFEAYARARQQLVSNVEARQMAGTDPLAPFRGLGIPLPSAEELNPEGRPASDVAAGLLLQGALPDPTDPVVQTAFIAAGKTIGLTARGIRAGARAAAPMIERGAEAAGRAGERIGQALEANAGRVAAADTRMAQEGSTAANASFGAVPDDEAARAARIAREQRITSDYGRTYPDIRGRINEAQHTRPLGEPSAEMLRDSRMPREVVHPDIRAEGIGPEIRPQVDTSSRLNATAGTVPVDVPVDRLAAVNRALGQGVASAVSGGVGAQVNQQMNPDDPNAGIKGFAAGALIPPLAARGGRAIARAVGKNPELRGAARATLGDLPGDAEALAEMRSAGAALPGMEDLASDRFAPVRGRVPGATPAQARQARAEMSRRGGAYLPEMADPLRPIGPAPAPNPAPIEARTMREALPDTLRAMNERPAPRLRGTPDQQLALPEVASSPGLVRRIYNSASEIASPWANRINTIRYAGMLSDTAGHVFNAVSGVVGQGIDLATSPIAAGLDAGRVAALRAVGRDAERQVWLSEAGPRIAGMRAGASVGLQAAGDVLRTGVGPEDAAKLDTARKGFGSGNKYVDFAFEAPLRAMAAADAAFRTSAQGGHLMAESYATARKLNGGKPPTDAMVREASKRPEVVERAMELAKRSVLQEDRTVTRAYQRFLRDTGPLGAAVSVEVPFVKTPYNVVAQGMGMTPLGLATTMSDVATGKSARHVEQQLARVMLGTAVMGAAAADYANGNLTGPYPSDQKEASTLPPGWRPWSRKFEVGGQTYYVPLAALGPLALPPVMAILAGEAHKKGKSALSPEWAGAVALGVGQYAEDQTFFSGITNIAKIFDSRASGNVIERQVEQTAQQFAPYSGLGREIQRVMGMPARDPEGAMEALLAAYPVTANRVEPAQDTLGRPRSMGVSGPAGALIRAGVENDAAVIRAYRAAKKGLPMGAPKQLRDPDQDRLRTLTPSQQHRWRRVFGQSLREEWANQGNPTDGDSLDDIASTARETANDTILGRR